MRSEIERMMDREARAGFPRQATNEGVTFDSKRNTLSRRSNREHCEYYQSNQHGVVE
jgi:hypothetical protein